MRATSWLFGRVGLRVRYWPGLILIKGFFARESVDRERPVVSVYPVSADLLFDSHGRN